MVSHDFNSQWYRGREYFYVLQKVNELSHSHTVLSTKTKSKNKILLVGLSADCLKIIDM